MSPQKRGFATLTPARRRAISSAAGKKSQANGTGHRWTAEEAREAGRKGGAATHGEKLRAVVDAPLIPLDPTKKYARVLPKNVKAMERKGWTKVKAP